MIIPREIVIPLFLKNEGHYPIYHCKKAIIRLFHFTKFTFFLSRYSTSSPDLQTVVCANVHIKKSRKRASPYLFWGYLNLLFHCCHITVWGQENMQNMSAYYTVQSRFDWFLLKKNDAKTKCSGMTNLLFVVVVDNMSGYFTHCSHFSSPLRGSKNILQLVKYPRVLSTKTQNKVYVAGWRMDDKKQGG